MTDERKFLTRDVMDRVAVLIENESEGDSLGPDPGGKGDGWVVGTTRLDGEHPNGDAHVLYVDTVDLRTFRVSVTASGPLETVRHRFRVSEYIKDPGGFFAYRQPSEWAADLLRIAGFDRREARIIDDTDDVDEITVNGTAAALTFLCVALNQHAEQTPWDGTPTTEGKRLEATLRSKGRAPSFNVNLTPIDWLERAVSMLGAGFHFDTPAADYIDTTTGEPFFPECEAEEFDLQCAWAFQGLTNEGRDPYGVALDLMRAVAFVQSPVTGKIPACPGCGETAWKVDEDVTNRAAIVITNKGDTVYVDRCGPVDTRASDGATSVNCMACALDVSLPDPIARIVLDNARQLVTRHDAEWRILNDYREF